MSYTHPLDVGLGCVDAGGERVVQAESEAPGVALREAGHPHMQRRRLDSAHINILRVYAQTIYYWENLAFCLQLCTVAHFVGFLPLPWFSCSLDFFPYMQRRRLDSSHINILITAKEHSARIRVSPFRFKFFFAYKRNKANLDLFHMCFTISL